MNYLEKSQSRGKRRFNTHNKKELVFKSLINSEYNYGMTLMKSDQYRSDLKRTSAMRHNHMCMCSCSMCGNPRRFGFGNRLEKLTMQERKAFLSLKDLVACEGNALELSNSLAIKLFN